MLKEITTKNAPAAIGPYSQAIKVGDFIYTSGQIPIDPATNEVISGGIEAQTNQVFKNLNEILKAADASVQNVVKTTVFLKNLTDFTVVNELYTHFFSKPYPARSFIEVARLPKDVLIEIEVIAYTAV